MCGISGWFNNTEINSAEMPTLQRMIDAIGHRGPDGQGSLIKGHAALGHARLAIIDLNAGSQPMTSHDNAYSIVFNGEIYNYKALRAELIGAGHTFKTHADTEVIMEIFRAHGWQGFNKLRGMFAFALWDTQHKTGFLVRDTLGIKPLFIHRSDQGALLYASEAKAILTVKPSCSAMDLSSLHMLLNFRYLPGQRTMFRDIEQLPPGAVLQWSPDHGIQTHTLTPSINNNTDINAALEESVRLHFTADVEVGTYLSGGMDSALITALGAPHAPMGLNTFTLQAGDDPNEAANAARTAQLLGVNNTQAAITTDIETELRNLIHHLEVPKINALQVNHLAQLAAKDVKVVLSGLGGDELFMGYNAHRIMLNTQRAESILPSIVGHALGRSGASIMAKLSGVAWSEPERAFKMVQSLGNWPRVYGLLRNVWDSPMLREKIYGPKMLDATLPNAFDELERLWPNTSDPVSAMTEFEWRNKMVNDLLWQEDRCSMAHGLEVRTPFVDVGVAAAVQRLSRQQLMPGGHPKGYMKQLLSNTLPAEILNRPKSGFQVSAPDFFHQHLKPLANRLLSEEVIAHHGLFNPAFIRGILNQPAKTHLRWHYFMLYFMLLTHLWNEHFNARDYS